ncbi:glycosyltransferase [bacterium]|nr:glycosyltransferase [bacterium]
MPEPRIALVLNELPLPTMSAAARSYHAMLREFARRGIDFQVLASAADTPEARAALASTYPGFHDRIRLFTPGHPLRLIGRIRNLLRPMSFQTGKALEVELRRIHDSQAFDIVHLEHPWTAHALPRDFRAIPSILGCHYFLKTDFEAAGPTVSLKDRIDRKRLVKAEAALVRRFDHVRVLSPEMAETLAGIHPQATAHIVPLAIDPADYPFEEPPRKLPDDPIVTMIGSMFWPPSKAAAERLIKRLWPGIREKHSQARLRIVGRDARRYFGDFDGYDRIDVFENVPDILPFFREASVLLYAPPAGSGTKVKIQEAMLLGLPVVTNRSGAEGLGLRHGIDAMLGDTDAELVQAASALLADSDLGHRLAIAARKLVEDHCGPVPVVDTLMDTYAKVIDSHKGKTRP